MLRIKQKEAKLSEGGKKKRNNIRGRESVAQQVMRQSTFSAFFEVVEARLAATHDILHRKPQ